MQTKVAWTLPSNESIHTTSLKLVETFMEKFKNTG